jgi:CRP-like cAMP-binding protein
MAFGKVKRMMKDKLSFMHPAQPLDPPRTIKIPSPAGELTPEKKPSKPREFRTTSNTKVSPRITLVPNIDNFALAFGSNDKSNSKRKFSTNSNAGDGQEKATKQSQQPSPRSPQSPPRSPPRSPRAIRISSTHILDREGYKLKKDEQKMKEIVSGKLKNPNVMFFAPAHSSKQTEPTIATPRIQRRLSSLAVHCDPPPLKASIQASVLSTLQSNPNLMAQLFSHKESVQSQLTEHRAAPTTQTLNFARRTSMLNPPLSTLNGLTIKPSPAAHSSIHKQQVGIHSQHIGYLGLIQAKVRVVNYALALRKISNLKLNKRQYLDYIIKEDLPGDQGEGITAEVKSLFRKWDQMVQQPDSQPTQQAPEQTKENHPGFNPFAQVIPTSYKVPVSVKAMCEDKPWSTTNEVLETVKQIYTQKKISGSKGVGAAGMAYLIREIGLMPFFKPFDQKIVEQMLDQASYASFPPNRIVYTEEEIVNYMYLVLSGRCVLFKQEKPGGEDEDKPIGHNHRRIQAGFSFGEAKFISLKSVMPQSISNNIKFVKTFQSRPVKEEAINEFDREEGFEKLFSMRDSYSVHLMQLSKLKAINKEQKLFADTVRNSNKETIENIRRNETVRTMNEELVVLKIDCFSFRRLVLPLIGEELGIKLFCLKRLPFLSQFMVEELIPITYHLRQKIFKKHEALVEVGDVPTSMLIIADGICDVEWLPEEVRGKNMTKMIKSLTESKSLINPLNKFSSVLHEYISRNCDPKNSKGGKGGFKVQRLMKGDALTVRATSGVFISARDAQANYELKKSQTTGTEVDEWQEKQSKKRNDFFESLKAQMRIEAASVQVRVFELHSDSIQYLPYNIKKAFLEDSVKYLDYDMNIQGVDTEDFNEWQNRKAAYYEEFLSKRKELIANRNAHIGVVRENEE